MIASETSRWSETTHGLRSVSTVIPPITAWAGMPRPMTRAIRIRSRRPLRHAATNVATATTASTPKSVRFPNSIAWW